MTASRTFVLRNGPVSVLLMLAVAHVVPDAEAVVRATVDVPTFEVDPFWPKPLDYPFVLGSVFGVTIDQRNNLFVVHGGNATLARDSESGAMPNAAGQVTGECCKTPLQIIQYDTQGNKVREFGGPNSDYTFPNRPWGIAVDAQGNVWVGGAGGGKPPAPPDGSAPTTTGAGVTAAATEVADPDTRLLKFGSDGRFMREIGGFMRPSGITFNTRTNEAFVADSLRIAVIDLVSGQMKRSFGAYGDAPDTVPAPRYDPSAPPSRQFASAVCAEFDNQGLLYVCDRKNNRIQVFRADGSFVREGIVAQPTLGPGSVWDIAFSHDPQQRFIYVADGQNHKVHILDRATLEVLSAFGTGGRYPGHFYAVSSVATDSQGNVYTGEAEQGKRVQKFLFKGIRNVTGEQGPAWPVR